VDAADIVRTVREVVSTAPPDILAVYLYGSRGRGDSKPTSDVDIGALLSTAPPRTLANVASALESTVERAVALPVEAVVMNGASPDLIHRVMRDGVLLLDRDGAARLEFEVNARNEYFDLEPVRRLYRRIPVTDPDPVLVAKKLAVIETCVRELRSLARPEVIRSDVRERRFIEHTLQIAIQAALDVASHVVADDRLGEPDTNRALFDLLASGGRLPASLASTMRDMAGFRNVLVHGYQSVDIAILEDVVRNRLDDLLAFVAAMRGR